MNNTFKRALWSAGAVLVGLVTVVILSEGTDWTLRAMSIFPPLDTAYTTPMLLAATVYRTAAGVVGGYVTAALAPRAPIGHAIALGLIGTALSITGLVVMWGIGPMWYPIALAALALPSVWFGGRLRASSLAAAQEGTT